MKNKIQKFSKGDFQLIRPDVIFDETNLVLIIGEGEVYRGSFTMRANNEGRIRGLVYSSSFRVHFKDQGFEGNPSRVEFTYDGRGLRPGHVEEGKFTIVCSGGKFRCNGKHLFCRDPQEYKRRAERGLDPVGTPDSR